jgi:hypothetical protein
MTGTQNRTIEEMKSALRQGVDEWLGYDIPAEDTEDYERWQSMLADIEDIETLQDVIDYVESSRQDVAEFFMCGRYDLIDAGMTPSEIPVSIISGAGEVIASQKISDGTEINVYSYSQKYFVVRGSEAGIFDNESDALKAAGIASDSENQTIDQIEPDEGDSIIHINPRPPQMKISAKSNRAVLVVVTEWPGGTMALKFGSALQSALRAKNEDMKLLQLSPERIFRVLTKTTERRFRRALAKNDVTTGGRILFIELEAR